jgi:plasmid maintenance system killer protein
MHECGHVKNRDGQREPILDTDLVGDEAQPSKEKSLNDQWRLVVELHGEAPNKTVVIVSIEDYH